MDETNTATSSSAAAVADGASAAAHTKTVVAPIKSASHVKLLIKASNQQYDDHVIESDLLWSVKRLKTHLSVVYPSKPPASDQKLIYSGQLLNDNLLLKDVIRSYKDVYTHNHIIHLVCTPKNLPPPPSSTNKTNKTSSTSLISSSTTSGAGVTNMSTAEGLRQRHTAAGSNVQQQQQQIFQQQMHPYFMAQQMMTGGGVAGGMPCPAPTYLGHYNMQALVTQQAIMYNWMQQVYSQYMEQCLRLSSTVNGVATDGTAAASNTAGPTPFPTFPQNFQQLFQQQFAPSVINPVVQGTTAQIVPNVALAEQSPEERQDQQLQQPAQAQVAAPRFPNMPQDEQENRDWLDHFFSITRLALFLTILYFNSSPLRCLVVVIIASGIYLYHIGVFRLRNERNNNNLNRNNNAAQNAAVDQIRQGVDQQQNAVAPPAVAAGQENNAAENANNNNENNTPAAPAANEVNEQQPTTDTPDNADNESIMSTIRTFVVTFFTSLLPETPAL